MPKTQTAVQYCKVAIVTGKQTNDDHSLRNTFSFWLIPLIILLVISSYALISPKRMVFAFPSSEGSMIIN